MAFFEVKGNFSQGFVADNYTIYSTLIGYDPFGNELFDTKYTYAGQLIHNFKYNGQINTSEAIASYCYNFIKEWIEDKDIDILVCVPPTKHREVQPVFEIANALSKKLNIPYVTDVLIKTNDIEAKDKKSKEGDLHGSVLQTKPAKRNCNILLIDDVYGSGKTVNECVSVLKRDPNINNIFYFAIAKTK